MKTLIAAGFVACFAAGYLSGRHDKKHQDRAPEDHGPTLFVSRPDGEARKIERLSLSPCPKLPEGGAAVAPDEWYLDWNGSVYIASPLR